MSNKIRKQYIRNMIYSLIKSYNKEDNNYHNNNDNKSLSLTKYNNKWDYSHIIYNYNNQNLLSNLKYKYIIKRYINNMLHHKLTSLSSLINNNHDNNNNQNLNIIGSLLSKDPIILYNHKSWDIILFIYKPLLNNHHHNNNEYNNHNNYELLISKIINNLITKPLQEILSPKLPISINIKPIILKYDYLDSDIYSKSLSKFISKYPKFDKIQNIIINPNLIHHYLSQRLSTISIMNKINYLLNLSSLNNKSLKMVNNYYSKSLIINHNLLYQYITGYDWKYKGKNYNSESNARALRYYKNDGKLQILNTKLNTQFKLNHYSANLTKSQSYIINKNGKYNINVTLSHF